MPLPALYFMMSILFFLSGLFWVFILKKSKYVFEMFVFCLAYLIRNPEKKSVIKNQNSIKASHYKFLRILIFYIEANSRLRHLVCHNARFYRIFLLKKIIFFRHIVFKIHYIMAVLVFLKSISLMFHSINFHFIDVKGEHVEAWAILFYITHL